MSCLHFKLILLENLVRRQYKNSLVFMKNFIIQGVQLTRSHKMQQRVNDLNLQKLFLSEIAGFLN